MGNFLMRLIVTAIALSAASWLIDGIQLTGSVGNILIVALLFGLVNAVLKPILMILSIPFLLLSLGLFAFVINGAMLLVTASLTDHLHVDGLWAAVLGSLVISIVTAVLSHDDKKRKRRRDDD